MYKSNKKNHIVVYTDGSCVGNGKSSAIGGIGIHFPNKELKDISKIYKDGYCTNQKTELCAILTALRYIKHNLDLQKFKICIKTDSQYSIDCITKWVYGWIKNGWMTKNNTPVANKEFIEPIYQYYERYDIVFDHVDAHTGMNNKESIANAVADKLATSATKKAQKELINKVDVAKYKNSSRYGSKNNKHSNTFKKQNKSKYGQQNDTNIIVELIKNIK